MKNGTNKEFILADLSLFAFDDLLNFDKLIQQTKASDLDMQIEVPRAILNLVRDNDIAFQSILQDINPNVSERHLNYVTSFLQKNYDYLPTYALGMPDDFDYLPESLMKMIIGKIFRRASDRINKYHVEYYFQILHALEIGQAQSFPVKRKLYAHVRNFKKGITDATDILHNATLSILDSINRGIIFCQEGFYAVGETLYHQSKVIERIGRETYEKVAEELKGYSERKQKIFQYYCKDLESMSKFGSNILAFAGVSMATAFAYPSLAMMIATALTGAPLVHKGIIFVVDGKKFRQEGDIPKILK